MDRCTISVWIHSTFCSAHDTHTHTHTHTHTNQNAKDATCVGLPAYHRTITGPSEGCKATTRKLNIFRRKTYFWCFKIYVLNVCVFELNFIVRESVVLWWWHVWCAEKCSRTDNAQIIYVVLTNIVLLYVGEHDSN
jgi:hypothetical protein